MSREEKIEHVPGFLFLKKNTEGTDYAVADVHGNFELLKEAMKKVLGSKDGSPLEKHDRFFMVGDLVDKGPQSLEIMRFILNNRKQKEKPQIYVTRGNHEENCLWTIRYLEHLILLKKAQDEPDFFKKKYNPTEHFKKISEEDPQYYQEQQFPYHEFLQMQHENHMDPRNGGTWLKELFDKEFEEGKIFINAKREIEYDPASEIGQIKAYFESCPYVIEIEKTAVIVHADLHMSDEELQAVKTGKKKLDIRERAYLFEMAAWWREIPGNDEAPSPRNVKRTSPLSLPVICGHDIPLSGRQIHFLRAPNTYNGDAGGYYNNVLLRFNLSRKLIELVNGSPDYKKPPYPNMTDAESPETLVGSKDDLYACANDMLKQMNAKFKLQRCFEFLDWSSPTSLAQLYGAIEKVTIDEENSKDAFVTVLTLLMFMPNFIPSKLLDELNVTYKTLQSLYQAVPATAEELDTVILRVVAESKAASATDKQDCYISTLQTLVSTPDFLSEELREGLALFLLEKADEGRHLLAANHHDKVDSPRHATSAESKAMLSALGLLIGNIDIFRKADVIIGDKDITIEVPHGKEFHFSRYIDSFKTKAAKVAEALKETSHRIVAPNGIVENEPPLPRDRGKVIYNDSEDPVSFGSTSRGRSPAVISKIACS